MGNAICVAENMGVYRNHSAGEWSRLSYTQKIISTIKCRLGIYEAEGTNLSALFVILIFNIYQIIANAIAWLIVAPTLDIAIYAEPANKVYLQGAVAGTSNIITVGVLGTILLYTYSKTRVKKGSLDSEY